MILRCLTVLIFFGFVACIDGGDGSGDSDNGSSSSSDDEFEEGQIPAPITGASLTGIDCEAREGSEYTVIDCYLLADQLVVDQESLSLVSEPQRVTSFIEEPVCLEAINNRYEQLPTLTVSYVEGDGDSGSHAALFLVVQRNFLHALVGVAYR